MHREGCSGQKGYEGRGVGFGGCYRIWRGAAAGGSDRNMEGCRNWWGSRREGGTRAFWTFVKTKIHWLMLGEEEF